MNNQQIDIFTKQQRSNVLNHLEQLGYHFQPMSSDFNFHAVQPGTVEIKGTINQQLIVFSSLWSNSNYAAENYNKYLMWINTLNLNALAVQFCANQVGSLSMQLSYFGEYDFESFDYFWQAWIHDVNLAWNSEARYIFLT